jgi:hypothetical protein
MCITAEGGVESAICALREHELHAPLQATACGEMFFLLCLSRT